MDTKDVQLMFQFDEYKNTAIVVFKFLMSLPETLSRFIFKRIVEEAYEIASCQDSSKATNDLSEIFLTIYESLSKKEIERLANCTNVSSDVFVSAIENREPLFISDELPDISRLIKCYTCFVDSNRDRTSVNDLEEIPFWTALEETLAIPQPDITNDIYLTTDNIFYKLLYIKVFQFVIDKDFVEGYSHVLYWYCKGEILDVVFDCIWKNTNTQIAKSLFTILSQACFEDKHLSEITKKRYLEYIKYNPICPTSINFNCSDTVTGIAGLALFKQDNENYYDISVGLMAIYNELVYKYLEGDKLLEFINIFCQEKNITPLKWCANNSSQFDKEGAYNKKSFSAFIHACHELFDVNITKNKFITKACRCFLDNNGVNFKPDVIRHSSYSDKKLLEDFKNIIQNAQNDYHGLKCNK
ncbi:MAG: hypothetical protein J6C92_12805 [Bacteroidaceae bacterium]|nr:hypothetical protein [Bacteroidaceae bacterium]